MDEYFSNENDSSLPWANKIRVMSVTVQCHSKGDIFLMLRWNFLYLYSSNTESVNLGLTIYCVQCWRVLLGWWWENQRFAGKEAEVTLNFPWNPWEHEYEHWIYSQDWLRQRLLADEGQPESPGSYGHCQLCWYLAFLIGNSSFHLLERGKWEKKSPFLYRTCSYTQTTITKLRQWIAGSLVLVYWDLMPAKGFLYVCFNYHGSPERVTVYADFLQCLTPLLSPCLRYLNFVFPTEKWKQP